MEGPNNQMKIHTDPYSKEGLGQQVIDMGMAIAKLSTDMEWVKKMLSEINAKLDSSNHELERMIKEYQMHVDNRLEDHEARIKELESFRAKLKGVAITITLLVSSGLVAYIIGKLVGG